MRGQEKYRNIVLIVLMTFTMSLTVQDRFAQLYDNIGKGNTSQMYNHLSDIVYIQLDNTRGAYSKKQAVAVLDKFFSYNKPIKFTLLFDRIKEETSLKYSIGNLYTNKGVFKTYIYIKLKGNDYFIQQIRLEKNK